MELTDKAKLRLEKKINSFTESYMSNSKWKKVFVTLLKHKSIITKCEIFDFFNSGKNTLKLKNIKADDSQYITQEYIANNITSSEYPKTYYKEIEYIEFPKFWSLDNKSKLISNKKVTQNTEIIKGLISKIGHFRWEENHNTLKLIGYRNN